MTPGRLLRRSRHDGKTISSRETCGVLDTVGLLVAVLMVTASTSSDAEASPPSTGLGEAAVFDARLQLPPVRRRSPPSRSRRRCSAVRRERARSTAQAFDTELRAKWQKSAEDCRRYADGAHLVALVGAGARVRTGALAESNAEEREVAAR